MTAERLRREVEERLAAEGLHAGSWSNGPGDRYGEHRHDYDKVLVGVAGSITFHVPDAGDQLLMPGDRLDLPAATDHAATVGEHGVTCLEAHVPAGTLGSVARHSAGEW